VLCFIEKNFPLHFFQLAAAAAENFFIEVLLLPHTKSDGYFLGRSGGGPIFRQYKFFMMAG